MPGLLARGPFEARGQRALPSVRPFAPSPRRALLRPLLTSRSALQRRPFRREARSPQVRAVAFPAPSPDLRRAPLVATASRSFARSPWDVPPLIRFLFVNARLRSPLLSAPPSRTVALRFARGPCDLVPQRTCTSWSCSCWAHKKEALAGLLGLQWTVRLRPGPLEAPPVTDRRTGRATDGRRCSHPVRGPSGRRP